MNNDQTQLPKPTVMLPAFVDGVGEYEEPMFDSMSMLEYGRACERAAYERAAELVIAVCEDDLLVAAIRGLGADK